MGRLRSPSARFYANDLNEERIMRIKLHICLLSVAIIYLTLFAISALSIEDPEGKSADQLLDESVNGIQGGDTRFPATPHESRALQEKSSKVISSSMPSSLSSSAKSPKEARAENAATPNDSSTASSQSSASTGEQSSQEQYANDSSGQEAQLSSPSSPGPASDLSGRWSLQFDDGKEVELSLYQNSGAVFGTGSMREENVTSLIAAGGSIAGDRVKLDLICFGTVKLYRLSLDTGEEVTGSYSAYPTSGKTWSGTVGGRRSSGNRL
jgi:hypothetical protein